MVGLLLAPVKEARNDVVVEEEDGQCDEEVSAEDGRRLGKLGFGNGVWEVRA